MTTSTSYVGDIGNVNGGGMDSHMFAEDGDIFYSHRHPTWVFALFVHMGRP
jgi:hypothetical protein